METIPTSQTFPLMRRHHCVPAVCSIFLQIVTKGCEWLRGAALRCPPLTSSSSLLFNSLTSVLTWTDRLPIHPLFVPHSPSSSPCIILSVSLLALEQCRFAHRRNHRRFRINSCLFLYKVASLSLSSCFLTHFFYNFIRLPFKYVLSRITVSLWCVPQTYGSLQHKLTWPMWTPVLH